MNEKLLTIVSVIWFFIFLSILIFSGNLWYFFFSAICFTSAIIGACYWHLNKPDKKVEDEFSFLVTWDDPWVQNKKWQVATRGSLDSLMVLMLAVSEDMNLTITDSKIIKSKHVKQYLEENQ